METLQKNTLNTLLNEYAEINSMIETLKTAKKAEKTTSSPVTFSLSDCFPKMDDSAIRIEFALPYRSRVTVTVFDSMGSVVEAPYFDEMMNSGTFECNVDRSGLDTGTYFYSLTANDEVISTKKLVLV